MRSFTLPIAIVVLLFLSGGREASAVEDGFTRGNQLYATGKYVEAVAAYEEQVRHGDDSANLFYNLGDAYHRVGNRGRAILNYQRALVLEPTHAEAAANLAFIGGTRSAEMANVVGPLNISTLTWLTSAACWLAVAGMLAAIFRRRGRTAGWVLAVAGMLSGMAGAGTLWWTAEKTHAASRALVIADGVPVLYSPADNSKVITTLATGAEVLVLSAQGPWSYAALTDGTRAWVSSGKIERLIPPRAPLMDR